MGVLERLASSQKAKSDVPNQILAAEIAQKADVEAVSELKELLNHSDAAIQSDAIKTLYEIGYRNASLIEDFYEIFLELIESSNNRMIWGAMIALSTVAGNKAKELFPFVEKIKKAMARGSVITNDAGISVLSKIASSNAEYNRVIFPYLMGRLGECQPKFVPAYAERMADAVNAENKTEFMETIHRREPEMEASQKKRLAKVFRRI